jgi:hypothetical protein
MIALEQDAINREEHACQKKKDPENTVQAYKRSSAFRSEVGESLRSPSPGRPVR